MLPLDVDRSELEYYLRRALATSLSDLISMDPADLVENVVELTAAAMTLLTRWHVEQGVGAGAEPTT